MAILSYNGRVECVQWTQHGLQSIIYLLFDPLWETFVTIALEAFFAVSRVDFNKEE